MLIIGAGGHGRVVAEAAESERKYDKISFLDDNNENKKVFNYDIVGKVEEYVEFLNNYQYAFVAIGNNEKRIELISKLKKIGFKVPVIIHNKSYVSKYSNLKEGTVILAGAVVNVNSEIGLGCIININASVDHDCKISDGVHISSGTVIRSMVEIGELTTVGAGSCIKSGSTLNCKLNLPEGTVI